MRDMDEIILLVCDFLDRENIDYVIVGGLAVIFYGTPRTTMDVDMVLKIPEDKIDDFIRFLKENDFFADKWDLEMSFRERSHCTIQDKRSMLRLDIKGAYTDTDRETINRRVSFEYKGKNLYIASAEDTIINKLLFGREQDIRDAEGIYVRQLPRLETQYIEKRCKKLHIWKEFTDMRKRVGRYLP